MNNISLIILASGFSRRFVSNKLLYEFHGKKLIEYAFDKASAFLDVIVVTQYMEIKEMVSIQDGKHIVICEYNGILCNPMLLPKRYYDRAKQLCNDKGAKQIIGDDTYLTVSLSEEEFMDIDEKTEAI